MDLRDILSIAIASLIVLVIAHIAVFWVVKSLYPPAVPLPMPTPAPIPAPAQVFTQPAVEEQAQTAHVPTYQAPIQLEAAREEGAANFTFGSSAPAQRDSGVAGPNA